MAKECGNPYKTARKAAGLTQERGGDAAQCLSRTACGIMRATSARCPMTWRPPCADAYDAQYLAITHLRMTSIGRQAIPGFPASGLARGGS